MSKYYVLGSGPIGTIACVYLLEKGFEVVLIDNSSKLDSNANNNLIQKKVKNIFSENFITHSRNKKILPVSSKAVGGFSQIWGGTSHFLDKNDFKNWGLEKEDLKIYYEYIVQKLRLPIEFVSEKDDFFGKTMLEDYDLQTNEILSKLEKNKIKINKKNINFSLASLFLNKQSAWNASKTIESLKDKYGNGFKHVNNFEITDIVENDSELILSSSNDTFIVKNSKVFVATGCLSSTFIASKLLGRDEFRIKNSTLRVFPLIWFGKKSAYPSKNTYPQIYFDFKKANNFTVRTQLYLLNSNLINSISLSKIFKKILTFVNVLLKNRLCILFVYSHSNNSTFYDFKINMKRINLERIHKIRTLDHWYVFNKFLFSFTNIFFLPIPFFKKFNNYGSFHLGSSEIGPTESMVEKVEFNEHGQLLKYSNLLFIDSSVMPDIPSGPVTMTSMALALKIISRIVK